MKRSRQKGGVARGGLGIGGACGEVGVGGGGGLRWARGAAREGWVGEPPYGGGEPGRRTRETKGDVKGQEKSSERKGRGGSGSRLIENHGEERGRSSER